MNNEEFLESISLEGEEWRPVVGWENLYAVSNLGRVAFLHRVVSNGVSVREIQPKLCKLTVIRYGYTLVHLWRNNKGFRRSVHRLVAESFLPNPENKPEVDHLNTITNDNRVENLRWVTSIENSQNPISLKRVRDSRLKVSIPIAKVMNGIIVEQYQSIKQAVRAGYNEQTIHRCLAGEKLPKKDYIWKRISDLNLNISDVNVL
ncbi:MAG: NUMOD4 motif-containing HNH endonuclease [Muribaculaceae bacterium]|nr:NUMOD4 motif-containing HNH endonuclease [Muribaculaceae bacterium]